MGSWRFIIIQAAIVALWVALNVVEVVFKPFDPYPFILLNLAFSTQAAYAAPLILMSSNRQASKDEARDDLEAKEVEDLHSMSVPDQTDNPLTQERSHVGRPRHRQTSWY